MRIIGVDYHRSFPQIAFFDQGTGECGERRLNHSDGEAEKFYRELQQTGVRVRVGMEATGYALWFERLLAELGFELWIGDAAGIKTKRVRKQKTDCQDAQLLLKLLLENRFPRIGVPSPEAPVPIPGNAPRSVYRQSGHGPQTRRSVELDVAQRMGLCAGSGVRFARGTA